MNILLADDHDATREELASLIKAHDDLTVVGQTGNGREAVRLAKTLHPDVIVMDLVMPGMNGLAATEAVRDAVPKVRVLALSNHTGRSLVKAMFQAGATGYVRKDHAYEELVPAIRAVAEDTQYLGEHVDE